MSVNLNTGHYEGGFLQFPEFGPDLYRPDTGDAVVYSSALLHEVTPITSGRRFTLLAHMYDEESRQLNPKYRDSD
jgi:predicted 2-oxoglutarate/Fe(II)-dependent dioxygenase YbiX